MQSRKEVKGNDRSNGKRRLLSGASPSVGIIKKKEKKRKDIEKFNSLQQNTNALTETKKKRKVSQVQGFTSISLGDSKS